jgi:uncharacterized membrane protein YbhN (UPF0104 family)
MRKGYKKLIKNLIGTTVILGIAYFLGKVIYSNWSFLKDSNLRIDYWFLLLSLLPLALSFYLGISAWKYILGFLGFKIKWKKAFWTVSGSHLAKFIPGHVLALGGRIWLCSREKIPEQISAAGIIIEMLIQLAASIFVFSLSLPYYKGHLTGAFFLISGVLFIIIIIVAHPKILPQVWKYIPKMGKIAKIGKSYEYKNIAVLLAFYIIAWCFQGLAVFILIKSLYPATGARGIIPAIGAYGGAYALGFVSIITPGGLGVREGILTFLLKFYTPAPIAVFVAVLSRLSFTLFDIVMTIISIKFKKPEV